MRRNEGTGGQLLLLLASAPVLGDGEYPSLAPYAARDASEVVASAALSLAEGRTLGRSGDDDALSTRASSSPLSLLKLTRRMQGTTIECASPLLLLLSDTPRVL